MKHLITGVAAIALAAAAAHGQGNSQGKGNDANRGKPAQAQSMSQGGGNQKGNADRGNQRQAERGNGKSMQVAMRANEGNRGQGNAKGNADRNENARRDENRGASAGQGNRGNANPQGRAAADRGRDNAAAQAGRGNENRGVTVRTDNGDRGIRVLDDGRRIFETRGARGDFIFADAPRGLINGCPPGLAKRNNGCRPPGLARQDTRRRYANFGPDWWGLRGLGEGRYFYDDGYLLRLDGDNVAGYIPLLGGALALGNPWPSYYDPVPVPDYYVDYFDLGPSNGYRYADNVLYRVDPETTAITSIAALLTGNDIQIGAPMPAGYDMYNVPYSYRDRYRDGPDALYRYNDGYIYQLDPATQLVTAAIELIAS
jgi:hypothetical protein